MGLTGMNVKRLVLVVLLCACGGPLQADPGAGGGTASAGTGGGSAGGGDASGGGSASGGSGGSEGGGSAGGGTAGPTGLEAFCQHYKDCGGSYYSTVQECMDASTGYWGSCTSRRAALDAFGDCMNAVSCNDWTPDAYSPASGPCASQWSGVSNSAPCQ